MMTKCAAFLLLTSGLWGQQPALEGMDPVLLTEGKEQPGRDSITLQHGGFLYSFASSETKDRFAKNPERYSIQLDGACARMGAPVRGNPDASYVYKERIYIFGSQACYKAFTADPEKYLSPGPAVVWNPRPETAVAGKTLLDKARRGVTRIQGYTLERVTGSTKETITARFPHGYRSVRFFAGGSFGTLLTESEAYSVGQNMMHKESGAFAAAMGQDWLRDPVRLLLGPEPDEVYLESANTLSVRAKSVTFHAVIDPETLVVKETRFVARGPDGFAGEYRITYSDWRMVDEKVRLPFRGETKFNDAVVPARSWTAEKYTLNPTDLAALLQVP